MFPMKSQMFTDQEWTFTFVDNDEPFDDLSQSDFMGGFNLNPVTITSNKDYEPEKDFLNSNQTDSISQLSLKSGR